MTEYLRKNHGSKIPKFPQCALCTAQCGSYGNPLPRICDKNFGKSMVLLKKLLNGSWFDDFFSSLCCAQHTVEITEFYCHAINGFSPKFCQINVLKFAINIWRKKICVAVNVSFFLTCTHSCVWNLLSVIFVKATYFY